MSKFAKVAKTLEKNNEPETDEPKKASVKAKKGAKEIKATKPTKTTKPTKAAKTTEAVKATKEKGAVTPRGKFAGKKIKVLNKDHGARDGSLRGALMDAILKAKSTDDVMGQEVTAGDKTAIVRSADINFAVENQLISLS